MMNVVTDFAVYMNLTIFAHIMVFHAFFICRIIYYKYFILGTIPPKTKPAYAEMKIKFHRWVPKFIMAYQIYAFFNIPFVVWYFYFHGDYWYFSHYYFIHYYMYFLATLIVKYIHHKEYEMTWEHFLKFPIFYLAHLCFYGWVLYACVNGNDEGDWKGWMEEDLYRFNDIPEGSIDWRKKP